MSEKIREMTGGHKCEHGSMRATAQFKTYAGPVFVCECCRSKFGSLRGPDRAEGYPLMCPTCASPELLTIYQLTDKVGRLEIDNRMLLRELKKYEDGTKGA